MSAIDVLLLATIPLVCAAAIGVYIAGYRTGIREGADEGRLVGFKEGYRLGEAEGYCNGYDRGLADASPSVVKDADEQLVQRWGRR